MTLFKTIHKRFKNFAEDLEENDFSAETVDFGQKVSAHLSRYGDFVWDIMLEVSLPAIEASATVLDVEGNTIAAAEKAAYWSAPPSSQKSRFKFPLFSHICQ